MQKFDIYVGSVIALVDSLVIKSIPTAMAMNAPLVERGEKIPADVREWKYYLHLAGLKHKYDAPVIIRSLDTDEDIELTKEALDIHKKTSNVYRYNQDLIKSLQYERPDMYHYIRGVFNPIPLVVSTTAPSNTVLSYDEKLVERQEVNLLTEISKWVEIAHNRYMFEGYVDGNDAYVLAFNNILKSLLPGIVLEIRTRYANTEHAHSFHINTYLESHQRLDRFVPYLTNKQKMFLYRNIRYIERNTGKQEIFEWLVDVLLTGWSMPTVAYSIGQTIHDVESGVLYPETTGVVRPLNYKEYASGRDLDKIDLFSIIRKEYDLAKLNPEFETIHYDELQAGLQLTQYPDQNTKLIEVTATDPENNNPFKIEYALFNEWVHAAASERYAQIHEILNPQSGDVLRMTTKEMLVLYLYAAFKGYSGVEIPFLNSFHAMGVDIKRWVPVSELENVVLPSYHGRYDKMFDFYAKTYIEHSAFNNIVSAYEFYSYVETINKTKISRYWYGYNTARNQDQAVALGIFQYHYPDYNCNLNLVYADYDDFFKSFGIDYKLIPMESWKDIAVQTFDTVTGYSEGVSVSHTEIQNAMIELISMLSSYTIHFAKQMVSDTVMISDCLGVVVDQTPYSTESNVSVTTPDGELTTVTSETRYSIKPFNMDIETEFSSNYSVRVNGSIGVKATCNAKIDLVFTADDAVGALVGVTHE